MGTPAFVVTGDLAFDGITYETALASVDVFVAAVALLCEVDESAVSVVISQARRRHLRRRLDDAGSVVVTYTVAVETEAAAASVSTLVEDSSTEDVSTAVKRAATEAGADEDFADVETTAVGTPTMAQNSLGPVCPVPLTVRGTGRRPLKAWCTYVLSLRIFLP